jgi:hypothetical protein
MRQATNYGDKRVITYQPEKTMREGELGMEVGGQRSSRGDGGTGSDRQRLRRHAKRAAAAAAAVRAPKRRGVRPQPGPERL